MTGYINWMCVMLLEVQWNLRDRIYKLDVRSATRGSVEPP